MAPDSKKVLEVVLKIAGRCNINCEYCYMFNKGNDDYLDQPSYMSLETLDTVIDFVLQGISDIGISGVIIIFHGGEPLMMKMEKFGHFCQNLRSRLTPHLQSLSFTMQTNGMLLTPDWIKLLAKYKVSVGISMDGPQEYNDTARLDHKGMGTYQRTVAGLRLMQKAAGHGLTNEPGVLCVINQNYDGRKIYRHFVNDLNITWISFLVPLETVDTWEPTQTQALTDYVMGIFEEWIQDDNPDVVIRQFNHFFNFLTSQKNANIAPEVVPPVQHIIIPIATNGDISVDDESKPINFGQALKNIRTSTLAEHIASSSYTYLKNVTAICPAECADCEWVGYCRGGAQNQQAVNRFSQAKGFNNRSIFCETYKTLYSAMAKHLLDRGMTPEQLVDILHEAAKDVQFGILPPIIPSAKRKFYAINSQN
jgi:uncharacterized protein